MRLLILICAVLVALPAFSRASVNSQIEGTLNSLNSAFLSELKYTNRNLDRLKQCEQLWKGLYERINEIQLEEGSVLNTYDPEVLIRMRDILKNRTPNRRNHLVAHLDFCIETLSKSKIQTNQDEKPAHREEPKPETAIKPEPIPEPAIKPEPIPEPAIKPEPSMQNVEDSGSSLRDGSRRDSKLSEQLSDIKKQIDEVSERVDQLKRSISELEEHERQSSERKSKLDGECRSKLEEINKEISSVRSDYESIKQEIEKMNQDKAIKEKQIHDLELTIEAVKSETELYKKTSEQYLEKMKSNNLI